MSLFSPSLSACNLLWLRLRLCSVRRCLRCSLKFSVASNKRRRKNASSRRKRTRRSSSRRTNTHSLTRSLARDTHIHIHIFDSHFAFALCNFLLVSFRFCFFLCVFLFVFVHFCITYSHVVLVVDTAYSLVIASLLFYCFLLLFFDLTRVTPTRISTHADTTQDSSQ